MPAYRVYRLDDGGVTAALRIEADDIDDAVALTKSKLGDRSNSRFGIAMDWMRNSRVCEDEGLQDQPHSHSSKPAFRNRVGGLRPI